jgi:hypothetical protein
MTTPAEPTIKLLNTIVMWDVYCVAGAGPDAEANACAALLDLISRGEINTSCQKALEIRVSPVRPQWRDQRPIVAADVSDEDFARIKGMTTQQVYDLLLRHPRSR